MIYAWESWKRMLADRLSTAAETTIEPHELVVPPKKDMGHLAYGCFKLAKERGVSPATLATELAQNMNIKTSDVARVEAAGPYVNVWFRPEDATFRVIHEMHETGADYGAHPPTKSHPWMFEYANPNTHKEIHVGHLRGFLLGASMVRLAKTAGLPIHPVSFVNDLGNNVAKCLWQLVRSQQQDVRTLADQAQAAHLLSALPASQHTGKFLGGLYTEATRALEADPNLAPEISFVQAQLEQHQPAWEHLWRETRRWCLDELRGLFQELGVEVEAQYLESDFIDRSVEIVSELERTGIAAISEGALAVNLEEEGLGVALLRKTDGTHLYLAKDLALAEQKVHDLPKLQRSTVLVDYRQSLHFRQLAAILKRMGFSQTFDMCGLEIVTLKSGAMSSRKGNIITLQTFIDEVTAYAREEVMKRHEDWPEGKVAHVSWAIAMAGMKFGMLKQDADKVFTFDMEQALAFDGDTGPYCQYAATRYASVLRKQGWNEDTAQPAERVLTHPLECELAIKIAQLPERIQEAASSLRPAVVSQWCIELAQCMNDVYRDVPVQDAEPRVKATRLQLFFTAKRALERGLWMLGIPVPEEM